MSEEMQKEILDALRAMREGAPAAWEHLVGEMFMRGLCGVLLGIVAALVSWGLARRAIGIGLKSDKADGEEVTAVILGVSAVFFAMVAVVTVAMFMTEVAAPSIALIKGAR